jgi:hypothetical protein
MIRVMITVLNCQSLYHIVFNLKSKTNEDIADELIQFINSKEYEQRNN